MTTVIVIVAAVLVVAVIAILASAARKPDIFSIRRSTRISAPADRIFPLIANLRSMNTWNPFVEPDPAIKISYSGPESGKGAAHSWSGNNKVGEGRLEIVEATAPGRVAMKLDMIRPMAAHNDVLFTLEPDGNATTVSWAMTGRQPFIGKLMTLFIDCDKMVGSHFDKGLASLKTIAEREVPAARISVAAART
jgi:Polyketide cyclase / dehydrase and lipid transport